MFRYVRVRDGNSLPDVSDLEPFKAIVIIEDGVTPAWQKTVSTWLVQSGCLFMMAWGHECSSWDDSVDYANLENVDYGDIPADQFVMTTWHADEALPEVFEFAKLHARHPKVELNDVLIVHIGNDDKNLAFKDLFDNS